MSFNHLEQIVAEWLEFNGYFVRRNIKVGRRPNGGYAGELDIVAFHPSDRKLVHYETSTDSNFGERENRFKKKFKVGREHIPDLFKGVKGLPKRIEQYALFFYPSDFRNNQVGGGEVIRLDVFLKKIVDDINAKLKGNEIVPEKFPLLRMVRIAYLYRKEMFGNGGRSKTAPLQPRRGAM